MKSLNQQTRELSAQELSQTIVNQNCLKLSPGMQVIQGTETQPRYMLNIHDIFKGQGVRLVEMMVSA